MSLRRLAVIAIACLAAAGCKTDPNQVLLERDLRRQEEIIYSLRGQLEETDDCLQRAQRENNELRRQLDDKALVGSAAGGSSRSGGSGSTPSSQPSQETPPRILSPALPGEEQPRGSEAPPFVPSPSSPSSKQNGQWRLHGPAADSTAVQRIALNPQRTVRLRRASGASGKEEALGMLIEPRDRQGRLVAAAAPLSIVVLDRRTQGPAARVARWDLSADDITALGKTSPGQGIYLELPWPARPAAQADLEVFVRYTTADGRKLEAREPLGQPAVAADGGPSSRWNALPPGTLPPPPEEAAPLVSDDRAPALIQPTGGTDRSPRPIDADRAGDTSDVADDAPAAPPEKTAAAAPRSRYRAPPAADADPSAQRPTWSPYR